MTIVCADVPDNTAQPADDSYRPNYVAGTLVRLNDNGAWSWFMDPRAIVADGKLIFSKQKEGRFPEYEEISSHLT